MKIKDILATILLFIFFSWLVVCVVMSSIMVMYYISCSDVLYSCLLFIALLFFMIATIGIGYILYLAIKKVLL